MRVAIVGAEETTRGNAPYDNPEFDIWVFNDFVMQEWVKRCTASIDIHLPGVISNPGNLREPKYWDWLKQYRGRPIYMQQTYKEFPDSIKYPLDEINTEFLSSLTFEGKRVKNFRSTVAYAIALALYQQYESIDIYGVELVANSEYKSEKDNYAFWVGVATGRKVPVTLHSSRGTFDMPLYGYEDLGLTDNRFDNYRAGLTQQHNDTSRQLAMLDGALQLLGQLENGETK